MGRGRRKRRILKCFENKVFSKTLFSKHQMNCKVCQVHPAKYQCSCPCQLFLCGEHCQKNSHQTYYESKFQEDFNNEKILITNRLQLISRYLKPYETIPMELHPDTTQVFYIERGEGEATVDGRVYKLKPTTWLVVPAGANHEIRAGSLGLQLKTIYSKPEH
jgi:mannose-6-phosphate isomerase-like protein (cupin superfamily)